MTFDLKNEEFVARFKKMMGNRRPTDAVMRRISRNLVLLSRNFADLKSASNLHKNRETEKGLPDDEVNICFEFFQEHKVLDSNNRNLETFFNVAEQKLIEKEKKILSKMHGNIETRSLQDCYDTFLPKIIRSMQLQEPLTREEDEDENGLLGDAIDLNNGEFDAGIELDDDLDFK